MPALAVTAAGVETERAPERVAIAPPQQTKKEKCRRHKDAIRLYKCHFK